MSKAPLSGEWRHASGFLFCGTLRIACEDFDTDPTDEFRHEVLSWIVERLGEQSELAALRERVTDLEEALEAKECQKCNVDGYWWRATKLAEKWGHEAIQRAECAEAAAGEMLAERDRLRGALKKMLSPETDWDDGEVGVGFRFRVIARAALDGTNSPPAPDTSFQESARPPSRK